MPGVSRFPFPHECGGHMHSEAFGDLSTGLGVEYKCDLCGESL